MICVAALLITTFDYILPLPYMFLKALFKHSEKSKLEFDHEVLRNYSDIEYEILNDYGRSNPITHDKSMQKWMKVIRIKTEFTDNMRSHDDGLNQLSATSGAGAKLRGIFRKFISKTKNLESFRRTSKGRLFDTVKEIQSKTVE